MSVEPNLDWTALVAERKIKEAYDAGEFDNLPGRGQPVTLDDDPFATVEQRVANRVLKNSRALPEWIQLEADIKRETEAVPHIRARGLRAVQTARNTASRQRAAQRVRDLYRERLDLVNTLILKYNMGAPIGAQRPFRLYKIADEMQALEKEIAPLVRGKW